MTLRILRLAIVAFGALFPSIAVAAEDADARYDALMAKIQTITHAGREDEGYALAKQAYTFTKSVYPRGDEHRLRAAAMVAMTAQRSQRPDQEVYDVEAVVADEAGAEPWWASFLASQYAFAAQNAETYDRFAQAAYLANLALSSAWARQQGPDSCTASAVAVLAGQGYRELRLADGDRLTATYERAVSGPACPNVYVATGLWWGFDAIVDGFMQAPDAERIPHLIELGLRADAAYAADPRLASVRDFFRGCRLVVQFVEFRKTVHGIERGFARALVAFPVLAKGSSFGRDDVLRWIAAMRLSLSQSGETNAIAQLNSVEAAVGSAPQGEPAVLTPTMTILKEIVRIDRLGLEKDPKAALVQARDLLRTTRATLAPTDSTRLDVALLFLVMARLSGDDPFEIRAVAVAGMEDAQSIRKDKPIEAANFELTVASMLAGVDGDEAYYERTTHALGEARVLFGDDHPCTAKFLVETSAAAYGLHQVDEANRLFDAGLASYAPTRRCAQGGELDSGSLLTALLDAGQRMTVADAGEDRIRKLLVVGRELGHDPIVQSRGLAPEADLILEGVIPLGLAASHGDKNGVTLALNAFVATMNANPQLKFSERKSCAAMRPFLLLVAPDLVSELDDLHCSPP